ncbi:hypothetical protein Q9233_015606 [Columba guinea]|nr:hypothetical protein Q9233_015606 [Columba guinea]
MTSCLEAQERSRLTRLSVIECDPEERAKKKGSSAICSDEMPRLETFSPCSLQRSAQLRLQHNLQPSRKHCCAIGNALEERNASQREVDGLLRSEENMLENMSHEGDVAQGYSIPRNPPNPKSPPWKIQMKEEPEPPTDDIANITAIACQKLYIKEEPPENLDYGKLFDPKIPLMALQGRQIKKEEAADGQHEWEEPIAVNHVLHVKEEPQENIEFGMHYGQKPNLSAMQRIQIKEEPGVETSHQKNQSPKRKQKKYLEQPHVKETPQCVHPSPGQAPLSISPFQGDTKNCQFHSRMQFEEEKDN